MKKIFLFVCAAAFLTSCSEQTSIDVSRVTNYPNLELIGDETIIVAKGSTFTDPGVLATEGGVEIPYTTAVSGGFRGGSTIDTNVEDIYSVTYTAVNQDGFSGSVSRTVIVAETGDLVNSLAGLYTGTVTRNGVLTAQYTDLEYVLIWDNGDGTYGLSDGIGGYYAIGRAYGNGYAAPATIITDGSPITSITVPDYSVGTFGGVVDNLSFEVNPGNNTIHFVSDWDAGFTFDVVLTQVQF